ncbi:hypothetical protein [Lacimicrobium alkaliphilum]|uniref:Uncharacterized protein n=1 Tax=Lacimicrobium alkaliphilum TaxID=1526571 RepID=A0ABQ1REN6_9ALTE|nr:hypothetical protein [Lacimicrobium alkaliphilum]GGD67975.1 hypothetical protein GCM10011357_23850 [Lacimicrobium alkaliphilum]
MKDNGPVTQIEEPLQKHANILSTTQPDGKITYIGHPQTVQAAYRVKHNGKQLFPADV